MAAATAAPMPRAAPATMADSLSQFETLRDGGQPGSGLIATGRIDPMTRAPIAVSRCRGDMGTSGARCQPHCGYTGPPRRLGVKACLYTLRVPGAASSARLRAARGEPPGGNTSSHVAITGSLLLINLWGRCCRRQPALHRIAPDASYDGDLAARARAGLRAG